MADLPTGQVAFRQTGSMDAICLMCFGSGSAPEQRAATNGRTVVVGETCRTCRGRGRYDAATGPGVDPDRRHGTGALLDAE